jgi:hypothetical protein
LEEEEEEEEGEIKEEEEWILSNLAVMDTQESKKACWWMKAA